MRVIILGLLIFLAAPITSQNWLYSAGEDVFDGKYRTAKIIGTSTDNTFKTPVLVLNRFETSENYNLYISDFGYFCDDPKLEIKFDDSPLTFFINLSEDNQQSAIFFKAVVIQEENDLRRNSNKFELLDAMMKKSTMYCRFTDKCSNTRMVFSLSGSGKAIRYVYGDQADEINEILEKFKILTEEVRENEEALKKKNAEYYKWRKNLKSGYALLKATGKYGKLFEEDSYLSEEVAKFTEADTVEVLYRGGMIKIITSDSIVGWCNERYLFPFE